MEFDGKIAEITIKPQTRRVIKVNFRSNPRFRCQRCAVFCCKLGGPKLLTNDVERLKQTKYDLGMFVDAKQSSLKSKKDGSCIFLEVSSEKGLYQCSVYRLRPTFCRLYPFQFEKSGPQTYTLKFIPCCNGLNTGNGEIIDEKFLANVLSQILFDLIDSNAI